MLVAFVGCSGVGKNTIIKDLLSKHSDEYDILQTLTTRAMRAGESQGDPYYFVSPEEFQAQIDDGRMYEHERIHGSLYGGSRDVLDKKRAEGKTLLKDIDILGANKLKQSLKNDIRVLSVFLYVEDSEVLIKRLRDRGDAEDDIVVRQRRFDMEMALSISADYLINNNNRELTAKAVDAIIRAETSGAIYMPAYGCQIPSEESVDALSAEARSGASLARVEAGFTGSEIVILEGADRYLAAMRTGAFVQKRISNLSQPVRAAETDASAWHTLAKGCTND